jgi:hypothetical protein
MEISASCEAPVSATLNCECTETTTSISTLDAGNVAIVYCGTSIPATDFAAASGLYLVGSYRCNQRLLKVADFRAGLQKC